MLHYGSNRALAMTGKFGTSVVNGRTLYCRLYGWAYCYTYCSDIRGGWFGARRTEVRTVVKEPMTAARSKVAGGLFAGRPDRSTGDSAALLRRQQSAQKETARTCWCR